MSLPVVSSGLPESFRIDLARNDLQFIATQAAEQVVVHEHATQAAADVLRAIATTSVPHSSTLHRLIEFEQTYSQALREALPDTLGGLLHSMVTPEERDHAGVSSKDVTRDALSQLHPDATAAGNDDMDTRAFKAITEARQNEDATREQGVYAGTVASRASRFEHPTATKLERSRYKAWLALQAGKGQFDTEAEVDAWRNTSIELVPYRVRATMLGHGINLYTSAIGITDEGPMRLPSGYEEPIIQGLKDGQQAVERIVDEDTTTLQVAGIELEVFDRQMGPLLEQLEVLLKDHITLGDMWTRNRAVTAANFGRALSAIAETLEGNQGFDAADIAFLGLKRILDLGRREEPPQDYRIRPKGTLNIISTDNNY